MENLTFGIIVMVLCFLGYYFSWKNYKKENFKLSLFLIIISGLSLYIYVSTDFFLHAWDERYHALVAKNLMNHPFIPTLYDKPIFPYDYENWPGNHIWLHKQPMPLWLMAGSMKIFGVNEIALRLPSIIMSTLSIYLTYKIGTYLFNKKTGLLASFLFSINGLIIELTGGRIATDHVDISFMFFILLSVFFSIKLAQQKSLAFSILIGLAIGAAVLTKWLVGLIVLPIWFLIILDTNQFKIKTIIFQFFLIITTVLITALPWQIYIFNNFPLEANYESSFNLRHFTEVIEGRSGSVFYFIDKIRINYGELIYIPLVWFLWKTFKNFKNFKNFKKLALLVWFIVPLIIFSFAKTKMQGYLLFTAPALFIITSAFFFMLFENREKHKYKVIITFILILFIAIPVRYGIERVKPFDKTERNPKWVLDLKNLKKLNTQNGVLLNYDNPIEAMFYTDLTVYPFTPSEEKIVALINQGYNVFINNKNLSNQIKSIKGINVITLENP